VSFTYENVLVSQLVLKSVEDNLRRTILFKKPSFYKETAFFLSRFL